jgi:hypothetical protein
LACRQKAMSVNLNYTHARGPILRKVNKSWRKIFKNLNIGP